MRQHAAHDERREFHAAKLLRQRPAPEDGRGVLAWTACLFADATAAAIEDGFPAPGAAAAPASEPEEAAATPEAAPEPSRPPHMGGRRAGVGRPLPDETRDDVAVSRARDRATRPPAAADDLEVDRLAHSVASARSTISRIIRTTEPASSFSRRRTTRRANRAGA
jgi:hypothetical protein